MAHLKNVLAKLSFRCVTRHKGTHGSYRILR